jgi:hypothetical protein
VIFCILRSRIGSDQETERRPYRTPAAFIGFFPALKRWANKHCAYGAGEVTLSALLL